jgi:hypothetical protein
MSITYTSAAGWHYTGTVPIPLSRLTLTKDISSSPPGSAKLRGEFLGDLPTQVTIPDDNPGRTNGPPLVLDPGAFDYALPDSFQGGFHGGEFGTCHLQGSGLTQYQPFPLQVECGAMLNSTESDDAPEAEINHIMAVLNGEKPTYVMFFSTAGVRSCGVFVKPTGAIAYAPDYDSGCGKLIAKVA